MTPTFHLVFLVFAFCCFAFDAGLNNGPTRITCAGLACLVASMISW